MMNKKAIAAFAAGATLLAGFAMATPAFAADAKAPEAPKKEAPKVLTLKDLQKAVKDAEAGLKTANEAKTAADAAAKKATEAWDAAKKTAAQVTGAKEDPKTHVYAKDDSVALTTAQQTALDEFLKKQTAVTTTAADAAKADEAVKTAQAALTAAQTALTNYKDPVKPAEASESDLSGALVRTSGNFDKANGDLQKAYSKYEAAYFDVDAAQAKADDAKAAYDKYVHSHKDMTKAEKVEAALLLKASNDANTELTDAKTAAAKAKGEFDKALREAHEAWAKYAGVYKAAKAKNASLVAGYALPSDVEPVAANYVPGVSHVTPGSVKPGQAGKPGAKQGQAGANGAAAGAKTTVVEKKKDGGKKLPGTGVGVTLTALAATMLAGMGAAVRKARH
ncbi:hypothetical protein QP840_03240 [Bifidobacterium sp. UMB6791A]|nr:hypothetical protein [Bifidobacterium sp. UMB6791B]MDK8248540.1 hypothetical protein [Bifidobacterium sp. UMB6794B]MDK8635565.1 hypothetical protein [Bifidobacterium sp. UMB6791A]